MSKSNFGKQGFGKSGKNPISAAPMDLDVTPVMNMLLILIPLLVSMAVLTKVSIIKFQLPSTESAPTLTPAPREKDITLYLSQTGFQLIGEGRKLDPIPKEAGEYNYAQLSVYLKQLKRKYPGTKSIVLLADTSVIYENIIRTMDLCRESQFPEVALSGGFQG